MSTIKKGTEVYMITDYDRQGTVIVRRMTVESLGKVRGTASYKEGGKMFEAFIDPDMVGKTLFAVADVADINAFALELAEHYKNHWIKHYRDTQHWYMDGGDLYHKVMKRDCEAIMAAVPSVIFDQQ